MAVQVICDTESEVPKGLTAVAKDGKFVVAALPDGWAVEDVKQLKSALTFAREERDKAKQAAEKFQGIEDPEAARKALEDVKAGRVKTNEQVEAFRTALQTEAAKAKQEADLARGELRTERTQSTIMKAMGDTGMKTKFRAIVEGRARWEKNGDGKEHLVFVGDDGKPFLNQRGDLGTAEEFVTSLQKPYPEAFEVISVGGAGAHGGRKLDPNASPASLAGIRAGQTS